MAGDRPGQPLKRNC